METARLKKFATEARNMLIRGVVSRLKSLGFDENGIVMDGFRPEQIQGGALFLNRVVSEDFYRKRIALEEAIKFHEKGAKEGARHVAEEAAYTWFNRFVAIRILQKNGLIEPQLAYAGESNVPLIVENARHGRIPAMDAGDRAELDELLDDDSKTLEQFAILIVAYCHMTPILANCFGHIDDYTELLLPQDILADGGFVWMLNNTDYITEGDYRQTELIGWLYQFYISEKKDEVFASFKNKKKAEADDIPAATQIFTPNWIVKYMVQNTLGRIYLDNKPNSVLTADWKYFVKGAGSAEESIYKYSSLESLKVADFACGSGHILNEFFDMLYAFYIDEDYSKSEAIENIFKKNLLGIDLDTRAKQLSMFSLLLKACQKDRKFVDAKVLPRVYDMPEVHRDYFRDTIGHFFAAYNLRDEGYSYQEFYDAFILLENASNFGSTMKFNISNGCRNFAERCVTLYENNPQYVEAFGPLVDAFRIILALTDKYSAIAMNPPYMGAGNMNAELSDYVKKEYPNGKTDLATVFIEVEQARIANNGLFAYIIPPSWMFLGTFEDLRKDIIKHNAIQSLLHLSRGVFGADFGASSAVIKNAKVDSSTGTYFRLVERTFQEFEQSHLRQLFEQTLKNHDFKYKFKDYNKDVTDLPYSEDGNRICYDNVTQSNFEKIPGSPIGYWVSEKIQNDFILASKMSDVSRAASGPSTGDTEKFLRLWHEVGKEKTAFEVKDVESGINSKKKWFCYDKGGSFRRWSGNKEYVINWENNGQEVKNFKGSVIRNPSTYFKENIAWSNISSGGSISLRYFEPGLLYDVSAFVALTDDKQMLMYILGLGNSKIFALFKPLLNPTFHFTPGDYSKIPFYGSENKDEIVTMVRRNISISKSDWDAHETSWDFEENPLVAIRKKDEATSVKLSDCVDAFEQMWTERFMQLHANEEELNQKFIELYGLQDELTPDVPLEEVTILQQGEIGIE